MKFRLLLLSALIFLAAMPLSAFAKSSFTDVSERYWAKESIEWAKKEQLTSGYPDGTFKPDAAITEAQLVTMLVRFDCTSPSSFAANKGEHKAMGNYRYLAKRNLPLFGTANSSARDRAVTKADAARIFAAYQGKDLSQANAVYYMYKQNLASGSSGKNNYADFNPDKHLTRAETAEILYKMSAGGCELIGLQSAAAGKDNSEYEFPPTFLNSGANDFERPVPQPSLPPPLDSKDLIEIDIEKPVLTANGKDYTFVTVTFRDCSGALLPYDSELEFDVKSEARASITPEAPTRVPDPPPLPLPPPPGDEPPAILPEPSLPAAAAVDTITGAVTALANAKAVAAQGTASKPTAVTSDGSELTFAVTAPKVTKKVVDTIKITPKQTDGKCIVPLAEVTITYEPKAELQLDVQTNDESGETTVTVTMAYPGGETIRNFNGTLHLTSAANLSFKDANPRFYNGVAKTTFATPAFLVKDKITATVSSASAISDAAVQEIAAGSYSTPVAFAPPITVEETCSDEVEEIGFLIDSSGSMNRNDRDRLRVTKTLEFLKAMNIDKYSASDFTTSSRFLERGKPIPDPSSIHKVKENGGTNIANGLKHSLNQFKASPGKRVLILLTDGKSDRKAIKQQIEEAKKQNIVIYTIGLGKDIDDELLKEIAAETKGQYFHISEGIQLAEVYQNILQHLNCGIPIPMCSTLASIFEDPSVIIDWRDIKMQTKVSSACGKISRVIVRFSSADGDIDYELTHRRHGIYQMNKYAVELSAAALSSEAVFIAFDETGYESGREKVEISKN